MSTMIKMLSIVITLFSIAAGASWYLQQKQNPEAETAKAKDEKTTKAAHGPTTVSTKGPHADATPQRPLVRPPSSNESDRIAQMATTLQQQQESINTRQQQLNVREKQLEVIHEHIKKEQMRLDGVRKEINAELQIVQEKIEQMEKRAAEGAKERKTVETQREELKKSVTELGGVEAKNVKQLAGIYDKMDAEAASQSIQQMVEVGKVDMAVSILANMRDRQAAGLLGEIARQDAGAAVQLFDRMRLLKTQAQATSQK